MHQRELLSGTVEYLRPSDRKEKGILFHQKYMDRLYLLTILLFAGSIGYWIFVDFKFALGFAALLFVVAIIGEFIFRRIYRFTAKDAVKYYALQLYEEPSEEALENMVLWNQNLFDFTTHYHYPRLASLVEEAEESDEETIVYVREQLPDELRLIERQERDNYQVLVDIDNLAQLNLDPYYIELLREVNYCYKFGAYTSASVLLRKITEGLIVDILTSKGLYTELQTEYHFEELVDVFTTHVLSEEFDDDLTENLSESLNVWIRKKGNKGAHKQEEFTRDEIELLMEHAKRSIRLLLVIRNEVTPEGKFDYSSTHNEDASGPQFSESDVLIGPQRKNESEDADTKSKN